MALRRLGNMHRRKSSKHVNTWKINITLLHVVVHFTCNKVQGKSSHSQLRLLFYYYKTLICFDLGKKTIFVRSSFPFSVSNILSFPYGHPVTDYFLFLIFLSLLSFLLSLSPSVTCSRRQFLCKIWPIQSVFLLFTVCMIFLSSLIM